MDDEPILSFSWLTPWHWGWRRYLRVVVWGLVAYVVSLPIVAATPVGQLSKGRWAFAWFHSFYAPLIFLINYALGDWN